MNVLKRIKIVDLTYLFSVCECDWMCLYVYSVWRLVVSIFLNTFYTFLSSIHPSIHFWKRVSVLWSSEIKPDWLASNPKELPVPATLPSDPPPQYWSKRLKHPWLDFVVVLFYLVGWCFVCSLDWPGAHPLDQAFACLGFSSARDKQALTFPCMLGSGLRSSCSFCKQLTDKAISSALNLYLFWTIEELLDCCF